ncbi:MAG: regulator [Rhodospirillaceae bacterium]|nr:regulator [Rhodospirillales bacterium]
MCWGGAALAQTAKTPPVIENYNIGDAYVRALANDPHRKSMWVGTSVGALEIDMASQSVKNTFTRKDGLANEYVFAVGVGSDAKVWFGTNAGGVSTYDKDGTWKTYFPMHGLADYWVYSFAFDKAGGVWIGTWDGANYVEPKSLAFKTYKSELINIWVYGMDIDPQGRTWFGTEGGVSMYDGKVWKSWTHKDGLGAQNVAELPRSANTGLGTRTREDLMVTAGAKESYNPNYVFASSWDLSGRGVWFGTWGGGASLFDGKSTWKSFSTLDGLAGNIVYSIVQDKDGGVWFGTNHGASYYDGKAFVNYTQADGLLGDNIYAMAIDPQGAVWLGTKGGVSRLVQRKK